MLSTIQELFSNEVMQTSVDTAGFNVGGVITSRIVANDSSAFFSLLVRVANAPTGTSPTLTFAVQQSNDQATWTQVGGALAALTAAGAISYDYAVGTTQGAITQSWIRVTVTPGGTNAVFTGVYADLVSQAS